jgi:hypothetical protein
MILSSTSRVFNLLVYIFSIKLKSHRMDCLLLLIKIK